jgi:hypothetical protein
VTKKNGRGKKVKNEGMKLYRERNRKKGKKKMKSGTRIQ